MFDQSIEIVRHEGEYAADFFSGAGGVDIGAEQAGWTMGVAINHDDEALAMHAINHPLTFRLKDDVWNVDVHRDLPPGPIAFAWFSPSCTHHSRARGGKPKDNQMRSLPWVAVALAKERRPRVIFVENVMEMQTWGPLDDKGEPLPGTKGDTFRQFVWRLETLGYKVEWRVLHAHHYGAPTSRKRLFMVARCDGGEIVWPDATHGPGLIPYRTAAECILWDEPCPSIFDRKRPLAEKTQARIAEGIRRFVLNGKPFVVGDMVPTMIQTGYGEREGQRPRALNLHAPIGTLVAGGVKHALVCAWIVRHFGGVYGRRCADPMGTVTAKDHHSLATVTLGNPGAGAARVAAFMTKFYGTSTGMDLREPAPTVTGQGGHLGLVAVQIEGVEHAIVDIGMRMLVPRELARAQGIPDSYKLIGTATSQTKAIGNSVAPDVARLLIAANARRPPGWKPTKRRAS